MITHQLSHKINTFISKSSDVLKEILNEKNTYLVGGVVRDIVYGKTDIKDVDIVTTKPVEIITKFSKKIRTKVLLDKEYEIYRIFLKSEENFYLDISKLQGKDIIQDLSRRDFSVNAVALQFENDFIKCIDPFNGIQDIDNRIIRMLSSKNLKDDPLRILRAFRLKAELDFEIDKMTKNEIFKLSHLLNEVALERIKGELFKILNTNKAKKIFYELYENKVLTVLFPFMAEYQNYFCGKRHNHDLLNHSFKVMEIIEGYCNENNFPIPIDRNMLNYETEYEAKLSGLLKLAALLHDVGKLFTKKDVNGKITYYEHENIGAEYIRDFLQKKRFATDTINFIVLLIKFHMYPFFLMSFGEKEISFSPRIYLKIESAFGENFIFLFNFAISDSYATAEDSQTKKVIDMIKKLYNLYIEYKNREKNITLLNGREIMQLLNIEEGPIIGRMLFALKEASLSGKVGSKEEAKEFVKYYYEKNI